MKVLYLFNNSRVDRVERLKNGLSDNSFYGLFRLRKYGIETDYAEIEQYLPAGLCSFLRSKILNVYTQHMPLIWRFFRYDIVFHVNSFASPLLGIFLHIKKPKWVLYDYSLVGLLGNEKTLKQKILGFIISHSAGIITISQKEVEILKERFPNLKEKIRFIRYGTDIEYYKPRIVQEENQVFVAGFDRGRDYDTIIAATDGLGIKVVVSDSKHLKKIGELPSHIQTKSLSDLELLDEYAKSKIIIIPLNTSGGVNDAMGCSTLVEAMAMGKAVIATKTLTMESYISHGHDGILVEEKSISEMREAIVRLLADEPLRKEIGSRARQFMIENCDSDKIAGQMAEFLKSL